MPRPMPTALGTSGLRDGGRVVVRGGRADRKRKIQPVPKKPTSAKLNARSGVERRKQDGLGILPRATTSQERDTRSQYNQVVVILLVMLGGITALAALEMILTQPALLSQLWPGPVFGLILVACGLQLALRPERRRDDRRRK